MQKPINGIAVDGYCSGNPGNGGYRGVCVLHKKVLFRGHLGYCTNNIAEFVAICHGLGFMKTINRDYNRIYSDSEVAIAWVKDKKCGTKLDLRNLQSLKKIITRCELFLLEQKRIIIIDKWETKLWGEIPADFGNKTK